MRSCTHCNGPCLRCIAAADSEPPYLMQHWSSRTGINKMQSLWCGWAVMGAARRFWFAGDTGYCGVFKEIGQKYGPFDLSAIPIGAYNPRWFLKPQHVDPAEAVQIHQVMSMPFGQACPLDRPCASLCTKQGLHLCSAEAHISLRVVFM